MKHLFLGIFMILFINSFSQNDKKISYSINIGSDLAIPHDKQTRIDRYTTIDYKPRVGFFSEININYSLTNKYTIASGINYTFSNLKLYFNEYSSWIDGYERYADINIESHSITIPIEIKYKFSNLKPISIGVGCFIGALTSNRHEYSARDKGSITTNYNGSIIFHQPESDDSFNYGEHNLSSYAGLSTRIEYTLRITEKYDVTLLTKFSYGWNNFFNGDKQENDLNYSLLLGIGIKV